MKFFGTDGIRQPSDKFTSDFITTLVEGLVKYAGDEIKVLIAGDTRESTDWILADLEAALETFGVEYSNAEVLPTPAICYCFYEMGFDFAIAVTASHNPYTDNGIKIFERGKNAGTKLSKLGCETIESVLIENRIYDPIPPTLRESLHADALDLYREHLTNYVSPADLSSLNLALDCANGATSVINKTVFEQLGTPHIEVINSDANFGTAINHNCGSTHLEALRQYVLDRQLDFGAAFDGDGDRCLLIDETGEIVDGDQILVILSEYLDLDTVATTVMTNQGFLNWAKQNNIKTEITDVGDSNVFATMQEKNIALGGEQSGHIILPGEPTGDGMLTALMIAKVISDTGKSLHQLASAMQKFPQVIVNMTADDQQKQAFKGSKAAENLLQEYSQKLEPVQGRLLVRPSGTEPLIRITMWGNDASTIDDLANELKDKLGEIL